MYIMRMCNDSLYASIIDSGPDGRMSLYRISITPKMIIPFEPNVHYKEFGIMKAKIGHYTETLFPLDRILIMSKKISNFGTLVFGIPRNHDCFPYDRH